MKVYLCVYNDWEHTDICKLYKDKISADIWLSQALEWSKKGVTEEQRESLGGYYEDGLDYKKCFKIMEIELI